MGRCGERDPKSFMVHNGLATSAGLVVATGNGAWPRSPFPDRVKTVKTFTNLAEAGFASSLLEASGIPASLADEQSFLMLPGPATGGIRLQVEDEDFDRATRVLAEGPDAPALPITSSPLETPPNESRVPVGLFVALAVALALLAFAVHQWTETRRHGNPWSEVHSYEHDDNHDGKPDHFYTYRGGKPTRVEVDRNFDGKIDKWEFCDREGRPERIECDENYDGRPDLWYFYENGQVKRSEQDTDFNGQPDWFTIYENGLAVRSDCRPNGSKIAVRRFIYVHAILTEEWVDEDQDGKFDYKILHDPFGATSARIPIEPAK
jgi:hypothetical protein